MAKRVYNEVITKDNIQDYAERLSICALRGLARIMGKYEIHKLYASLIKDIKNKDEIGYVISDSYDIVQEAVCFLFNHIGERLSDRTCKGCHGEVIDLKTACYRHLGNYIQRRKRENEHNNSLEAMEYNEPFTEDIRLDNTEQEKEVDEIIERMKLSVEEKETLLCYMSGMGYVEIAKYFKVTNTTIWYRRQRIQRKYNAITR